MAEAAGEIIGDMCRGSARWRFVRIKAEDGPPAVNGKVAGDDAGVLRESVVDGGCDLLGALGPAGQRGSGPLLEPFCGSALSSETGQLQAGCCWGVLRPQPRRRCPWQAIHAGRTSPPPAPAPSRTWRYASTGPGTISSASAIARLSCRLFGSGSSGSGLVGLASVGFALLALEDLGERVAGPAVAVIAVTVVFSVVAHGASAEPLARRYGKLLAPAVSGNDPAALSEMPTRRLVRRAPTAGSGPPQGTPGWLAAGEGASAREK
jgi:hypothetical protein